MILPLLLLAGLAGPAPGTLPAPAPQKVDQGPRRADRTFVRCVKCRHQGRLACGSHPKADSLLEDNVLFCSFVGDCASCLGAGWVDCERCTNTAVEARLERKRAKVAAHAGPLERYSQEMGRELLTAESEHFVLVCEVDGLKVAKQRFSQHALLHLYVDRLEALYRDYVTLLGVDGAELERKSEVFLWQFLEDHREAGRRFCSYVAQNGVYRRGDTAIYSVWYTKRFFRTDEHLYRNLVHHVVHGLASHQKPQRWLGNIQAGWADAGLAHWFEDRVFGMSDNYCYQEVNAHRTLRAENWRPKMRAEVLSGDGPSFAGMLRHDTDDLSVAQHRVALSVMDFLMGESPQRVNELLRALRSRVPVRDALREVYGWNPLRLEELWKAWVLDTYPSR